MSVDGHVIRRATEGNQGAGHHVDEAQEELLEGSQLAVEERSYGPIDYLSAPRGGARQFVPRPDFRASEAELGLGIAPPWQLRLDVGTSQQVDVPLRSKTISTSPRRILQVSGSSTRRIVGIRVLQGHGSGRTAPRVRSRRQSRPAPRRAGLDVRRGRPLLP